MKRSPMPARRTPLRSRTALERRTPLRSGRARVRHVERAREAALRVELLPAVVDAVLERDQFLCVRCGRTPPGRTRGLDWSIHHRRSRRVIRPDTHMPGNLVLLCGSGSTGCHGWTHEHPVLARRLGLIVRVRLVPAEQPVTAWYGRALLDNAGGMQLLTEVA